MSEKRRDQAKNRVGLRAVKRLPSICIILAKYVILETWNEAGSRQ
jgi:hypothetical protein